jgi:hypothetical protein
MANPSVNKVNMSNNVRFSLVANTEKTIVLPAGYNCRFAEIVNDNLQNIYIAVGDRIAAANTETRLMTSSMTSIIIKPLFPQSDQAEYFKEISFFCTSNATISFMSLSPSLLA